MNRIKIENADCYDPLKHAYLKTDLAIADGKIVSTENFEPEIIIDAHGCLVTPGLIDFHLHCFTGGTDGSCDADTFCLPNGVTTCIDAGSSGTANFTHFYTDIISTSVTRVLALLHVAPEGLVTGRHPENQDPAYWDLDRIADYAERFPQIVGVKIRQGHNICDPYGLHDEPLKEGIKLADQIGKKVVVHVNDPNVSVEKIAETLRPGDVFCHMYAGKQENIVGKDGHVKSGIQKARERGVLFDACNGRGNFLFSVADSAIADGFLPDIISSDNSPVGNYIHPLISLPRLLSKYLMYGMSLADVLDRATITPARWLDMESLASLETDTEADIAIWKVKNKNVRFLDLTDAERTGKQILVPQMTIRHGTIVYAQADFQ